MTSAKKMKDLRDKRRKENKCTRCGKKIKNKQYTICSECREYLNHYKKHGKPPEESGKVINRSPINDIENNKLAEAMRAKDVTTKKLAKAIGVAQRTVQHWLYDKTSPLEKNKNKINEYFQKKIF